MRETIPGKFRIGELCAEKKILRIERGNLASTSELLSKEEKKKEGWKIIFRV